MHALVFIVYLVYSTLPRIKNQGMKERSESMIDTLLPLPLPLHLLYLYPYPLNMVFYQELGLNFSKPRR